MKLSIVLLLVSIGLLSVACGASATSTQQPTATTMPTPTATPQDTSAQPPPSPTKAQSPYADIYLELLRSIPDTEATRAHVVINNYQQVREMFDIAIPEPEADQETLFRYSSDTFLPGPFISGYTAYLTAASLDNRQSLSFDMRDINQSVATGDLEIARGSIQAEAAWQAVKSSVESCQECPPPDLVEHQGIPFYSWGEDLKQNLRLRHSPPAFDHLGRGGRLAFLEGYAFRSLTTGGIKGLIDAHLGEQPSLADDEAFRRVVSKLAEQEPFTFFIGDLERNVQMHQQAQSPAAQDWDSLSPGTKALVDPITYTFEKELEETPPLAPYNALAVGRGRDEQGCYLAAVMAHDNAEAAAENLARLTRRLEETSNLHYLHFEDDTPRPWQELLDTMELDTEGEMLWVKLRFVAGEPGELDGEQYRIHNQLHYCAGGEIRDEGFILDPLFMHE